MFIFIKLSLQCGGIYLFTIKNFRINDDNVYQESYLAPVKLWGLLVHCPLLPLVNQSETGLRQAGVVEVTL